jgi:hypothetical protein
MARTIYVILRNEIVFIVELRILGFLVPLRARLGRIFRCLAHGHVGRANIARPTTLFLRSLYEKDWRVHSRFRVLASWN